MNFLISTYHITAHLPVETSSSLVCVCTRLYPCVWRSAGVGFPHYRSFFLLTIYIDQIMQHPHIFFSTLIYLPPGTKVLKRIHEPLDPYTCTPYTFYRHMYIIHLRKILDVVPFQPCKVHFTIYLPILLGEDTALSKWNRISQTSKCAGVVVRFSLLFIIPRTYRYSTVKSAIPDI